jgi:hypothetical protein
VKTKSAVLILSIFLLVLPLHAQEGGQFDSPNLELESRLHKIFLNYNSKPVDEQKWQSLLGAHRAERYRIQAGDTLWDISETFFGDGSYWTKLWSENDGIENPHQILPKKNVQFVAGNEASAPSISLSETTSETESSQITTSVEQTDNVQLDENSSLEPEPVYEQPEIPAPSKPGTHPLKKLPSTFVDRQQGKIQSMYDGTGLDVVPRKALSQRARVILPYYLTPEVPKASGTIDEIEVGEETAGALQSVFLKLNGPAQIGHRFSVVMPKEKITSMKDAEVGTVMEVQGTVEIAEVLDESHHIYRAVVMDCINAVRVGAMVLDEPLTRVNFAHEGPRSETEAHVLGGESDRQLMASNGVVYLDIGSNSSLHEGDILSVHSVREIHRQSPTDYPQVTKPVALIKVAKIYPNLATAIVLSSFEEIRKGYLTGGAFIQQSQALKSQAGDADASDEAAKPEAKAADFDGLVDGQSAPQEPSQDAPAPDSSSEKSEDLNLDDGI